MKIQALHNQSVFDLVLQYTGSVSGVVDFAKANNISITDELIAGNYYFIPEGIISDTEILNYYNKYGFLPATGSIDFTVEPEFVIGRMIIEQSFIIK